MKPENCLKSIGLLACCLFGASVLSASEGITEKMDDAVLDNVADRQEEVVNTGSSEETDEEAMRRLEKESVDWLVGKRDGLLLPVPEKPKPETNALVLMPPPPVVGKVDEKGSVSEGFCRVDLSDQGDISGQCSAERPPFPSEYFTVVSGVKLFHGAHTPDPQLVETLVSQMKMDDTPLADDDLLKGLQDHDGGLLLADPAEGYKAPFQFPVSLESALKEPLRVRVALLQLLTQAGLERQKKVDSDIFSVRLSGARAKLVDLGLVDKEATDEELDASLVRYLVAIQLNNLGFLDRVIDGLQSEGASIQNEVLMNALEEWKTFQRTYPLRQYRNLHYLGEALGLKQAAVPKPAKAGDLSSIPEQDHWAEEALEEPTVIPNDESEYDESEFLM